MEDNGNKKETKVSKQAWKNALLVLIGIAIGLFLGWFYARSLYTVPADAPVVGISSQPTLKNTAELKAVEDAVAKLDASGDYTITTYITSASDSSSYIELVQGGASYTLLPISEATGSTVAYQSRTEDTSYYLSDYITADNKMYLADTQDGASYTYYSVPDDYAKLCRSREVMFADLMLKGMYSLENTGTEEIDIGDGTEVMTLYEGKLASSVVCDVLSTGSYKMYTSLKDYYKDDEGIVKLMSWYLDDLSMDLVFSDAKVMFGVDKDGMLRYVTFECGGAGTRLYLTKCILKETEQAISEPSFADAHEYREVIQDVADMCKDFDSMEEFTAAMYGSQFNYGDTEYSFDDGINTDALGTEGGNYTITQDEDGNDIAVLDDGTEINIGNSSDTESVEGSEEVTDESESTEESTGEK